MKPIKIPIHRLSDDVKLPAYAYPGDAGLDLASSIDIEIAPFERRMVSTGIQIAIPEGFAGFVLPRSGLASKQGLTLANAPGLIDSHYRGEVFVSAINLDPTSPVKITSGERIAQLVVLQIPPVQVVDSPELDETERGSGGFGSSGQ